jgi:TRAP-type uncharacterized transport system substrate-binding protein
MAKRLNDEDRRPGDEDEGQWVARRHPEVEAAEFEAEQPARDLSGLPKLIISMEAPVKVVAVPNYLVANRSMDPELAYQLTKLLFDQKKALAEVHPSAGRLELETAPKVAPLELHPGAKCYYDEQAST